MPKFLWTSAAAMSVELCAHIAHAEKWPLFGLQYGMEVSCPAWAEHSFVVL
jgi:hypothetical protein